MGEGSEMRLSRIFSAQMLLLAGAVCLFLADAVRAQAPVGPITPKPGAPVQQAPDNARGKIKVRVNLVSTPVSVRDAKDEMVVSLNQSNFRSSHTPLQQTSSHFDVPSTP